MTKYGFKIYTLGCKVNQYDSSDLSRKLISAGFELVKKDAQIAIINTCCVTKTAISKCKRMVNKAKKENPKAKIIVMGCWPKAYKEEVRKMNFDFILDSGNLDEIINKFSIANFPRSQINLAQNKQFSSSSKNQNFNRSRYFIKIQDGCRQFCSYCIIPYTRGKLKSRSMREVVREIRQAVKAGHREVVLCGIHLGLYGQECKNQKSKIKVNLVELLKGLMKIKGLGRIRLSSIEVTEVSDELIKLITNSNKICKHLHIPLQSGCDKILKLMNRPYTQKFFRNKIKKIIRTIPDISITTDVIVGFPNETSKDFKETYNFIKEMQFSRLHVFPFSAHERTLAAKMHNKINKAEIEKRAKKLRWLGKKLEKDYKKKFIGKELDIVVEHRVKSPVNKGTQHPKKHRALKYVGKTEYYFDVEFIKSQIAINNKSTIKENKELIRKIVRVKNIK